MMVRINRNYKESKRKKKGKKIRRIEKKWKKMRIREEKQTE